MILLEHKLEVHGHITQFSVNFRYTLIGNYLFVNMCMVLAGQYKSAIRNSSLNEKALARVVNKAEIMANDTRKKRRMVNLLTKLVFFST